MTSPAQLAAKLRHLLAENSVSSSACGQSFLKLVRPLLDAGVIVEQRAPGGGRRLAVINAAALRAFLNQRFPDTSIDADALSRVAGIAHFRDSKALASDTPEIVLIRAWREGTVFLGDRCVDAESATTQHGLLSFLLRPSSAYSLRGACALVENPAVFCCFESTRLDIELAIHYRGHVSQRLIDWLATQASPDFSILHMPDYDPTGLAEFERLRTKLESRVRLHLPADLEDRFARFSNRALLDKARSRIILAGLRAKSSPEVQRVLTLINRHNAGLEQEVLLL